MSETNSKPVDDSEEGKILRCSLNYKSEAAEAKRDRMEQNRINFDCYNLKADWGHKKLGQSKEFLPRMYMAVEQIASFMHQALMDMGEWFKVEAEAGVKLDNLKIKPEEIGIITARHLEKTRFDEVIEDSLKLGLIGALMPAKVFGIYKDKPTFYAKDVSAGGKVSSRLFKKNKKVWQLKIATFRHEDWFPDPTTNGLYHMQQLEMDLHEVYALARGENAIYDLEAVKMMASGFDDVEQAAKKARETGQNMTFTSYRKRCKIWEFWGTIIDPSTGEILFENVVWTIANDRHLIQKPTPNPNWHGEHPFVVTPIVRTPHSEWHKTLMDAVTQLNLALNEEFNLMLDTGIMAAFGIRQLRTNWLEDPTQIAEGIGPATTLLVGDECPPNGKVLEPVQTAELRPEVNQMYQNTSQELNAAALTNDLRMGVMPSKQVKATEVVEASQTITSMFTGIAKIVEQNYVGALLRKAWMTIAQNMDNIDLEELKALIGDERARAIAALSPAERFASTAGGVKFRVFGISLTLNKMKDFKKIVSLLQTIGSSEVMVEEFVKQYDFGKLLTEIIKSLDIDVNKIKLDDVEKSLITAHQQEGPQQAGAPGSTPMNSTPNQQSNIPQAMAGKPESAIPHSSFPPSRALEVQHG